jgi:hypothetical protein
MLNWIILQIDCEDKNLEQPINRIELASNFKYQLCRLILSI